MSKPISRLWLLGPPAAILFSLLVYYAKFQTVRQWVDANIPWVAENIGSHLTPFVEEARTSSASSGRPSTTPSAVTRDVMPEAPGSFAPAPPPPPSFLAADGTVDVQKLATDRSAWPQTVTLKKAKEFPAVVNGKAVGKVEVPAGTSARLVSIQNGKLGLEYQGGGAWLPVEETDLAQRLRH